MVFVVPFSAQEAEAEAEEAALPASLLPQV
jgi:hypothetical protein